MFSQAYSARFSGIQRLYGQVGLQRLALSKVAIIGIGGVGSWVAEACARSGVGQLTLIDLDDICVTNINRQIHASKSTIGQSKVAVMKKRIQDINPECGVQVIEDFIGADTLHYLTDKLSYVVDAIDSVAAKAATIDHCVQRRLPLISIGGAGGKVNPQKITVADLAGTYNDPLLAKTRNILRRQYGFPKVAKKKFKVDAVYSSEQLRYPTPDGGVSLTKQRLEAGSRLDCAGGFGAISTVTATFAFVAVSHLIDRLVKKE